MGIVSTRATDQFCFAILDLIGVQDDFSGDCAIRWIACVICLRVWLFVSCSRANHLHQLNYTGQLGWVPRGERVMAERTRLGDGASG